MPLLETVVGSALFAKGAGLLTGLLEPPHPHDGAAHDLSSFLGPHVVAPHVDLPCASHSDFLFGGCSLMLRGGPPARHDTAVVELTPKLSMFAGLATAASVAVEAVRTGGLCVLPFADGKEDREPETGWCKAVPRGLRFVLAADAVGVLILVKSLSATCDLPLKTWILGGILLGFPTSYLVNHVANSGTPRFKWFRLTVTERRDGGDPAEARLGGLVFYDKFSLPIDPAFTRMDYDGAIWSFALLRDEAELVTGYQLLTHNSTAADLDPVCWTLEGSFEGINWQLVDEVEGQPVPTERDATTAIFEDLLHLEEATGIFRGAFLLEVAANAAAFAWLVAGTSWVSGGAEMCIDSAPLLWYSCYLIVVVVWSFLGTVTTGLIVSAVAMVLMGSKSPST